MTGVFVKGEIWKYTHTGRRHAKLGVVLPQAGDPPEAVRGAGNRPSLQPSEGTALRHLEFRSWPPDCAVRSLRQATQLVLVCDGSPHQRIEKSSIEE